LAHLLSWVVLAYWFALASLPSGGEWFVVERVGRYGIQIKALGFSLGKDALETINQIFMVAIALKHFKSWHNKCIFFLYELLEQFDIIGVSEVVLCEAIDIIHQFVLALWQRTLRTLVVIDLLLGQPDQFEA
jgi:hypothetical protein